MNAKTELVTALVANVGEIAVAAVKMHAVLKEEHQVLVAGDDARLLELTGIKTQLLQRLESLENERTHLLAGVGGGRNVPFAMEGALRQHPLILGAWEEALKTLAQCRALNDGNGSAVELRLRQVRQALALLTGASNDGDLYGPRGSPESLRGSKTLARI